MATLYTQADSNIKKTWLYSGLFLGLIVLIGYIFSNYFGSWFYFWFAFLLSILLSISSYWFSDKITLAMTGAKEIKKEDNPELYRLVENLCITAGLPLPKIYIINDPSPNAFATGRDPKHSVIVVTRGLLERLEKSELEGVISHELSHIGNRDTLLATIIVILVGLVIRLTDFFFRMRIRPKREEKEGASLIFFFLSLFFLILAPIFAQLIRFAISRKREFLADASGALLTRYPEGLARALEKISTDPNQLRVASNSTAHLFIVNPFKGEQTKNWIIKLFSTHPPVEERIKVLREMSI